MHAQPTPETDGTRASSAGRGACPIADAVAPLLGAERVGRVDPVESLATLLDLTGSMALAAHLGDDGVVAEPTGSIAGWDGDLEGFVADRMERLTRAVERRLADLPASRSAIWSAERLHGEIQRRGLAGAKRARPLRALAGEACDAYALAMRGMLERIRGEARGLRAELGPRIAVCGPASANLERLDALVARARSASTGRLLARIPPALVGRFAEGLALAVRALEPDAGVDAVDAWYAAEGFVGRLYAESGALIRGVLEHERVALVELVAAVRELEGAGEGTRDREALHPAGASGLAEQTVAEQAVEGGAP